MNAKDRIKGIISRYREDPDIEALDAMLGDIELALDESTQDEPEIRKTLVCTTAHVPRRLAEGFDYQTYCPEGIVYNNVEHGWLIRYWPPKDIEERAEMWKLMPVSLRAVIEVAEKNGCKMILFDNDAEELEEVKTYEW